MSSPIWMVIEAPSIGRRDVVNDRPSTLMNARRVLYSLAARLETNDDVTDLSVDYHVSGTGALCEGLRWRLIEVDGVRDCPMYAYLTDDPDAELLTGGGTDGSVAE